MTPVKNSHQQNKKRPANRQARRQHLLLLPIALCGFALAQPVYQLLLSTPMFLLARQNTPQDVWALTFLLSLGIPLLLALPSWLMWRHWPRAANGWCWLISGIFASLFVAQLLQSIAGQYLWPFLVMSVIFGLLSVWVLMFTRWSMLVPFLLVIALVFPGWFLIHSKAAVQTDEIASLQTDDPDSSTRLPDIVFLILDELPLATLLDRDLQIDANLFPNFARLQAMSTWYFDTTSVSDGTVDAVPAILTSHKPRVETSDLTVAARPINLFTILGNHYRQNVAESVTRLCPNSLCPRTGPSGYSRFKALLLDLSAIYLHRLSPDQWQALLPEVSGNWSGFFAEKQIFFPDGWLEHTGQQTIVDRPAFFRHFIASIEKQPQPTLDFMHILLPHPPLAFLPDGRNYGLEWARGQISELWGDVEWGLISAKQRHYLQVQFVDKLLGELLDRLQQQTMLEDSMLVVVSDHGVNFALNDIRRALSASNEAAMLRVPLFIKYPGQTTGKRVDSPTSTIDILPTLTAALGISTDSFTFDGLDLQSSPDLAPRQRFVSSYLDRDIRVINEASLDLRPLVQQNYTQLKLDDPQKRLWDIGLYDKYRGQHMSVICEPVSAAVKFDFDGFKPLPNSDPDKLIRAFVSGKFSGSGVKDQSTPFLITSNGIIVASGNTWKFNNDWLFFALVEPVYATQADWAPKVWLLEDAQCLGL